LATGCAIAMVAQRNPLYSAISLIGVLLSLACLYVMLAAPFHRRGPGNCLCRRDYGAGHFRIMLLNVEVAERRAAASLSWCRPRSDSLQS